MRFLLQTHTFIIYFINCGNASITKNKYDRLNYQSSTELVPQPVGNHYFKYCMMIEILIISMKLMIAID